LPYIAPDTKDPADINMTSKEPSCTDPYSFNINNVEHLITKNVARVTEIKESTAYRKILLQHIFDPLCSLEL